MIGHHDVSLGDSFGFCLGCGHPLEGCALGLLQLLLGCDPSRGDCLTETFLRIALGLHRDALGLGLGLGNPCLGIFD